MFLKNNNGKYVPTNSVCGVRQIKNGEVPWYIDGYNGNFYENAKLLDVLKDIKRVSSSV